MSRVTEGWKHSARKLYQSESKLVSPLVDFLIFALEDRELQLNPFSMQFHPPLHKTDDTGGVSECRIVKIISAVSLRFGANGLTSPCGFLWCLGQDYPRIAKESIFFYPGACWEKVYTDIIRLFIWYENFWLLVSPAAEFSSLVTKNCFSKVPGHESENQTPLKYYNQQIELRCRQVLR